MVKDKLKTWLNLVGLVIMVKLLTDPVKKFKHDLLVIVC